MEIIVCYRAYKKWTQQQPQPYAAITNISAEENARKIFTCSLACGKIIVSSLKANYEKQLESSVDT